jgi:flagellum-specific peptidoglycan hydrolase FlgJ
MEEITYKTPEPKRRYAAKNREKVIAASLAWNRANKDKMNDAAKRHYDKKKNDPEFKKINALKVREWAKNNPHKVLEQSARKRATKLQRMPRWLTDNQKRQIKEIYEMAQKVSTETGVKHHVDHIIPLRGKSVSGLHVPWNLAVITADENMRKSNKLTAR